jgi:hypothetical protein
VYTPHQFFWKDFSKGTQKKSFYIDDDYYMSFLLFFVRPSFGLYFGRTKKTWKWKNKVSVLGTQKMAMIL